MDVLDQEVSSIVAIPPLFAFALYRPVYAKQLDHQA